MKFARFALVILTAMGFAAPLSAAPFRDGLVTFGDSLSDTGQFSLLTDGAVPGPGYESGRFTNGPVWVEYVAAALGQPAPLPFFLGGSNYAFGGAQTTDPGNPVFADIIHMDQQVALYLEQLASQSGPQPRHDLFVIWGGANDFLMGGQTDPTVPAENIGRHIQQLNDAGGRNFLVPNLPLLGEVPDIRHAPDARAGLNLLTGIFNETLEQVLRDLEAERPNLNIIRLDVAALFDGIWAEPQAFGFVNTTDPAVPGLEPGAPTWSEPVEDPETYMFWDGIHPTTRLHELIAVAALLALEGAKPQGHFRQTSTEGTTALAAPSDEQ